MGSNVDPCTPVVVGAGQFSERCGDPEYSELTPIDLATNAVRRAIEDTGCRIRELTTRIDTAIGIRSYADSIPSQTSHAGNYPRSVCDRVGADPERAILGTVGGHTPQRMLTELAGDIAAGRSHVGVLFGSEAVATQRYLAAQSRPAVFGEHRDGQLEDRGLGLDGLPLTLLWESGLTEPTSQFAVFENARRARLGMNRDEYAQRMGRLLAPMQTVAAANPHAVARSPRSVHDLITATVSNRYIAQPYTRSLVAQDRVNQAAAVVIMSRRAAQRLGVDPDQWVYLHGHGDVDGRRILDRTDLSQSPAAVRAVQTALTMSSLTVNDVSFLDLYSCFPIAVFTLTDGLGLDEADPRGFTVTGGLPFFGGPGNNYAMHAICETYQRIRETPATFGMVSATGGPACKYSVGVYSTTPCEWQPSADRPVQDLLDSEAGVDVAARTQGAVTVETYTVKHTKDGPVGIVAGRCDDGQRVFATTRDTSTTTLLTDDDPIGQQMHVRPTKSGNTVEL